VKAVKAIFYCRTTQKKAIAPTLRFSLDPSPPHAKDCLGSGYKSRSGIDKFRRGAAFGAQRVAGRVRRIGLDRVKPTTVEYSLTAAALRKRKAQVAVQGKEHAIGAES
jgi:hypothetical protein